MRPLLAQYPQDKDSFTIDNEYMLGDKLLIRPVLQKGVTSVDVYFPSKNGSTGDLWYDVDDFARIDTVGTQHIPVDSYKVCFVLHNFAFKIGSKTIFLCFKQLDSSLSTWRYNYQ